MNSENSTLQILNLMPTFFLTLEILLLNTVNIEIK